MPCTHLGPEDVMEKAEQWLRDQGVPGEQWPGIRMRHGENTPDGMWASVLIEIERRGNEWWVTKLDRRKEPLPVADLGLRRVG